MWIKTVVSTVFALALFINALLFIPQAMRIWRNKNAKAVSLLTFTGFLLINLSGTLYGYFDSDYILFYGYLLSVIASGLVVIMILYYR